MAIPISGASNWLTINKKPLSFQPEHENEALKISEYSTNLIEITHAAPAYLTISIDGEQLDTTVYGKWFWKAEHFAGLYQLVVEAPDHPQQIAWVRVFPHKFSQHLYEQMKTDLSRIAIDLFFRLDSPAVERAEYAPRDQDTSPLHDYRQIRGIIEQLSDVIASIRREPYRALHTRSLQQDVQEISHFSNSITPLLGEYLSLPEPLMKRHKLQHLPQYWTVQSGNLTYDTYENRLLKQFLRKQLIAKLDSIQEHAENEKKQREAIYARYHNDDDGKVIQKLKHVIAECDQMKERCFGWSSEVFLKQVHSSALTGKATQVLLKHPVYSRFYQLYLEFQKRLKTTAKTESYITEMAMRRVSELYEMWSVFSVTKMAIEELLAAGYRITSNTTFYEIETNYFQFDVRKNVASIILLKDDVRVEIKYEPVYPNQSTIRGRSALVATIMGSNPQTPDMTIEVYRDDRPEYVLIFDAKYRWEKGPGGIFYPKQKDIDTMYRYRNNIQYRLYDPRQSRNPYTLKKIVSSAYILYPGNRIHTEDSNKIGSLPFFPGISPHRHNEVREQLKDLLYYAYLVD